MGVKFQLHSVYSHFKHRQQTSKICLLYTTVQDMKLKVCLSSSECATIIIS